VAVASQIDPLSFVVKILELAAVDVFQALLVSFLS
jgi:hypothetical protein